MVIISRETLSVILKTRVLRYILFIALTIMLIIPAFNWQVVYPLFVNQIIEDAEEKAIQIGTHLSFNLKLVSNELSAGSVSEIYLEEAEEHIQDFHLEKVKIFTRIGKVIFSTESVDLGTLNTHDYFHDIVATGAKFTNFVEKGAQTLEGRLVKRDVVETYVPIMRDGRFVGAHEVYLDITERKRSLDDLVWQSSLWIFGLCFALVGAVVVALFRAAADMNKRSHAEDEHFKSEKRLREILNNTTSVICLKDIKGHYLFINSQYEKLFHISNDEILGKTDYDLFPKEVAEISKKNDLEVLETNSPIETEENVLHDDGLHTYISIRFPLRHSDDQVYAVCDISTDITDRKQVEVILQETQKEAEKANKAKSEFLSAMSHDLRTPLNAIMGFSDMMRMKAFGPLGDVHYEHYVDDIYNSGSLLVSLINDVLDLSKVEAGKYELAEESLDISSIIQMSIRQLQNMANTSNQSLSYDVPSDMPSLFGDERAMIQILNNLISNAIKFSRDDGNVTVGSKVGGSNGIIISVSDTGIGMSEEGIVKALKPFEQADGTHSRRHEGTGLGLHLCTNLMMLFGGSLNIESKVKHGTTVTLRFPPERTILPL